MQPELLRLVEENQRLNQELGAALHRVAHLESVKNGRAANLMGEVIDAVIHMNDQAEAGNFAARKAMQRLMRELDRARAATEDAPPPPVPPTIALARTLPPGV